MWGLFAFYFSHNLVTKHQNDHLMIDGQVTPIPANIVPEKHVRCSSPKFTADKIIWHWNISIVPIYRHQLMNQTLENNEKLNLNAEISSTVPGCGEL